MDIRKIIKSRSLRDNIVNCLAFLPDKPYLRLYYFAMNGHWIHFKNPKGYNEKLQWLKLNDKHEEYTVLADKLREREVIRDKLGDGYTFPVLGVWNSFDEIDFDIVRGVYVYNPS